MKIDGLGSKPEYNGTMATIESWDDNHGRWALKMDYDGTKKKLALKNITVVDESVSA